MSLMIKILLITLTNWICFILVDCNSVSKNDVGFRACFPHEADDGPSIFDGYCKENLLCYSYDECQGNLVCKNTIPVGDEDFCKYRICGEDEGDCDSKNECQSGLGCASCPASLGFNSNINCCTQRGVDNGGLNFCTSSNPCSIDEGNCNFDSECKYGLICSNHCSSSFGFGPSVNCCSQPILGDEYFCGTAQPCGKNEGDCDSDNECQSNLFCGSNNCPASLDFNSGIDCCSSTQIMSPNYPNSYPKNAEETWLLTAPTGSKITLQFHSFQVRLILEFENWTKYEFRFLFC